LSDELKSRVGGLKSRLDEVNKEKYVNSHYKNALQKAPFDSFENIKLCVCMCRASMTKFTRPKRKVHLSIQF
jgi:hypothetical protein